MNVEWSEVGGFLARNNDVGGGRVSGTSIA